MIKRVVLAALCGGLVLVALAGVLVVRTVTKRRDAPLPAPAAVQTHPGAADRLAAVVRFQTVTVEGGELVKTAALAAQARWLESAYPRLHAAASRTLLPGGTLMFEWRGNDPTLKPIILMAHQDVVPASPDGWQVPPFEGAFRDGAVWGRGALDDKGSLIAILEAVESRIEAGVRPRRTVWLVFGADEEGAGSGARAAAAFLAARKVRASFVLDEGSLVIADHPLVSGPVALIGVSEKGYVNVRLTARGAPGHASAPPNETSVSRLAEALLRVKATPFPLELNGPTEAMIDRLAPDAPFVTRLAIVNRWLLEPILVDQIAASPQGAALLRTTIAPTMLSASPKDNVLAAQASATLNIRIAPGQTIAGVVAHIRKAVGDATVDVDPLPGGHDPSPISPMSGPAWDTIAGAAEATFGAPAAPAPVIAATDARAMVSVADAVYRFQPVVLTLEGTAMMHGTNERISVEALDAMIDFYGRVLESATQ